MKEVEAWPEMSADEDNPLALAAMHLV